MGKVWVTAEQASVAQHRFKEDVEAGEFLINSDVAVQDLVQRCEGLSRRHTARYGTRIYDLIHVASALILNCDSFWSFDQRARALAKLEGLKLTPID